MTASKQAEETPGKSSRSLRVGAIIWTTSRVQEMLSFYRCLGIPLETDTHEDENKTPHFEADLNGIHYAVFEAESPEAGTGKEAPTLIGFAVEDIERTLHSLEALAVRVKTPLEDTPWGKRSVVYDPDGRAVEIFQPPE